MELYVQKELKDKIEPLQEHMKEQTELNATVKVKVDELDSQII